MEGQSEKVSTAPIIIFEGILSLYDIRIRNMMDIKIFVLTDDDIRLARRCKVKKFIMNLIVLRDCSERARTVEGVLN